MVQISLNSQWKKILQSQTIVISFLAILPSLLMSIICYTSLTQFQQQTKILITQYSENLYFSQKNSSKQHSYALGIQFDSQAQQIQWRLYVTNKFYKKLLNGQVTKNTKFQPTFISLEKTFNQTEDSQLLGLFKRNPILTSTWFNPNHTNFDELNIESKEELYNSFYLDGLWRAIKYENTVNSYSKLPIKDLFLGFQNDGALYITPGINSTYSQFHPPKWCLPNVYHMDVRCRFYYQPTIESTSIPILYADIFYSNLGQPFLASIFCQRTDITNENGDFEKYSILCLNIDLTYISSYMNNFGSNSKFQLFLDPVKLNVIYDSDNPILKGEVVNIFDHQIKWMQSKQQQDLFMNTLKNFSSPQIIDTFQQINLVKSLTDNVKQNQITLEYNVNGTNLFAIINRITFTDIIPNLKDQQLEGTKYLEKLVYIFIDVLTQEQLMEKSYKVISDLDQFQLVFLIISSICFSITIIVEVLFALRISYLFEKPIIQLTKVIQSIQLKQSLEVSNKLRSQVSFNQLASINLDYRLIQSQKQRKRSAQNISKIGESQTTSQDIQLQKLRVEDSQIQIGSSQNKQKQKQNEKNQYSIKVLNEDQQKNEDHLIDKGLKSQLNFQSMTSRRGGITYFGFVQEEEWKLNIADFCLSSETISLFESFQNMFQTLQFITQNIFGGDESQSLLSLSTQIEFFKSIKNYRALGICFNNMGNIHYNCCRYKEALESYSHALIYAQYEIELYKSIDYSSRSDNQRHQDFHDNSNNEINEQKSREHFGDNDNNHSLLKENSALRKHDFAQKYKNSINYSSNFRFRSQAKKRTLLQILNIEQTMQHPLLNILNNNQTLTNSNNFSSSVKFKLFCKLSKQESEVLWWNIFNRKYNYCQALAGYLKCYHNNNISLWEEMEQIVYELLAISSSQYLPQCHKRDMIVLYQLSIALLNQNKVYQFLECLSIYEQIYNFSKESKHQAKIASISKTVIKQNLTPQKREQKAVFQSQDQPISLNYQNINPYGNLQVQTHKNIQNIFLTPQHYQQKNDQKYHEFPTLQHSAEQPDQNMFQANQKSRFYLADAPLQLPVNFAMKHKDILKKKDSLFLTCEDSPGNLSSRQHEGTYLDENATFHAIRDTQTNLFQISKNNINSVQEQKYLIANDIENQNNLIIDMGKINQETPDKLKSSQQFQFGKQQSILFQKQLLQPHLIDKNQETEQIKTKKFHSFTTKNIHKREEKEDLNLSYKHISFQKQDVNPHVQKQQSRVLFSNSILKNKSDYYYSTATFQAYDTNCTTLYDIQQQRCKPRNQSQVKSTKSFEKIAQYKFNMDIFAQYYTLQLSNIQAKIGNYSHSAEILTKILERSYVYSPHLKKRILKKLLNIFIKSKITNPFLLNMKDQYEKLQKSNFNICFISNVQKTLQKQECLHLCKDLIKDILTRKQDELSLITYSTEEHIYIQQQVKTPVFIIKQQINHFQDILLKAFTNEYDSKQCNNSPLCSQNISFSLYNQDQVKNIQSPLSNQSQNLINFKSDQNQNFSQNFQQQIHQASVEQFDDEFFSIHKMQKKINEQEKQKNNENLQMQQNVLFSVIDLSKENVGYQISFKSIENSNNLQSDVKLNLDLSMNGLINVEKNIHQAFNSKINSVNSSQHFLNLNNQEEAQNNLNHIKHQNIYSDIKNQQRDQEHFSFKFEDKQTEKQYSFMKKLNYHNNQQAKNQKKLIQNLNNPQIQEIESIQNEKNLFCQQQNKCIQQISQVPKTSNEHQKNNSSSSSSSIQKNNLNRPSSFKKILFSSDDKNVESINDNPKDLQIQNLNVNLDKQGQKNYQKFPSIDSICEYNNNYQQNFLKIQSCPNTSIEKEESSDQNLQNSINQQKKQELIFHLGVHIALKRDILNSPQKISYYSALKKYGNHMKLNDNQKEVLSQNYFKYQNSDSYPIQKTFLIYVTDQILVIQNQFLYQELCSLLNNLSIELLVLLQNSYQSTLEQPIDLSTEITNKNVIQFFTSQSKLLQYIYNQRDITNHSLYPTIVEQFQTNSFE
ncbi:hypothetical protein ABPG74_020483 [Tetrahymena malaccensis]